MLIAAFTSCILPCRTRVPVESTTLPEHLAKKALHQILASPEVVQNFLEEGGGERISEPNGKKAKMPNQAQNTQGFLTLDPSSTPSQQQGRQPG